ncbi:MAG: polymerase [Patescibacteria group bacterium]|nr:polymerase [Patescibacteria group bacterium]
MESPLKKFIILDGNALLHRAWHAIPPLTTKDGLVVNAAYGFTNVVEKMLQAYKPDYMAVAWDLPGGTFRHEAYEPYKGTREKKADELYAQIPIIQGVMEAYGIPSFSVKGYEADDILGTVAKLNEAAGGIETLIVTGDLDSLQLVSPLTKVIFFIKGLSEVKVYDEAAILERYKLTPHQLIDLKTLLGDTSDNLPGVAGIGAKGAAELLAAYGSIDGLLKAMHDGSLPDKFAKKLVGQEQTIALMRKLVTIVRDVPLEEFDLEQAVTSKPDTQKLLGLFKQYEFKQLIKKYEAKGEAVQHEIVPATLGKKLKAPKAVLTRQVEDLSELETARVALIVEAKAADLFGGGLAKVTISDGQRVFVATEPQLRELTAITTFLATCRVIVVHDLKAAMHALARVGVASEEVFASCEVVDTLLAAYLISSSVRDFGFAEVVEDHLKVTLSGSATTTEYCAALLQLADVLVPRLQKDGMASLYRDIEAPLVPVLFKMERDGILVDKTKLQELSSDFAKTLDDLTKKIYKLVGKEFNINSPSQLADILFIDLGLPTKGIKKTKTGYSTAAPELEKLADESPIIAMIEEYREVAKLKSTYADSLPQLIAEDGRIHTTFSQTVAATGRLSSLNPNVQNIPIRSALGLEIRKAFMADEGKVLLSADYSQIELRLAAHMANDESFIRAFKDGVDVHRRTAAEVWEIAEVDVTKDQRAAAKAINFSILYGVGARSLGRATGLGYTEAKDFIERYFEVHPAIRDYMDAMKLKARTDGYVETLFGRRRYLPDATSGMPQLVAAAERMAVNMPVQGTQADILKIAMIKIADWLKTEKLEAKMLLQVHDELVFEVTKEDAPALEKKVRELMGSVIALSVPLVVDVGSAKRWGEIE